MDCDLIHIFFLKRLALKYTLGCILFDVTVLVK